MNIAIIAFTDNGNSLLESITNKFSANFYRYDKTNESVKDFVSSGFNISNAIVFIGAVGIAVRLISDHIKAKDKDPAIIVIDEKGSFVIPILSGHIGGANKLALQLADAINAIPVITTATDINNVVAIDEWSVNNGFLIGDISKIKIISSALLRNQEVAFYSDYIHSCDIPSCFNNNTKAEIGVCLSINDCLTPFATTLNIIPKIITLGVGCRKNIHPCDFEEFVLEVLKQNFISIKAVKYLSSIELKKDELCLIEFARKYNIEFTTFSSDELKNVEGTFTSSEFVKATTGVDNVCERSAVLQSGGKLIVSKVAKNGMTIAISCGN